MTGWIGSIPSLIVHTIAFIVIFGLLFFDVTLNVVLLILTTAVSLEAIYMAIFIQMTVNRNTQSLEAVEEDIDDIQEDVEGIEKDIDEIHVDVEGLEKDVDEIQEDVGEMTAEETRADHAKSLEKIEQGLAKIMGEIEVLRRK